MVEAGDLLKGVSIMVFAGIMLALSVVTLDEFISTRGSSSTNATNETWIAINETVNFTLTYYPVSAGSVVLYNGSGNTAVPTSNYTVWYLGDEHDFNAQIVVEFVGGVTDEFYRNETVAVNYTYLGYGEEVDTLNKTLEAYTDFGDWFSTIVLVIAVAIILGLVLTLTGRRMGGI